MYGYTWVLLGVTYMIMYLYYEQVTQRTTPIHVQQLEAVQRDQIYIMRCS